MNAELAGLAWSTASKVSQERDKLRDALNEIEDALAGDWGAMETCMEIERIIERWRA